MVGDLAAAVDVDDLDAAVAVPVLAERQLARDAAAPARVDRVVLEEQERVGDLLGLARLAQAVLQRERLAVRRRVRAGRPTGPWVRGYCLPFGVMEVEPLWRSRLRWRWRGALLWPAFVVLTLVDALLLGVLPIAGDGARRSSAGCCSR